MSDLPEIDLTLYWEQRAAALEVRVEELETELATLRAASAGQLIDPSETVPRRFQQ